MTMRNTFGTIASGAQEPGSALDANFNDMGQLMGITQCSATGTNAITLTPAANQPNVSSPLPQNMQQFSFVPAANSTGAVTAQIGSGSFVPVFEPNGIQAAANSIVTTSSYIVTFLTALNAGAGGFVISGGFVNVSPFLRSYLAGLTGSTAGGSGTMSIAAGISASDDQTTMMSSAAFTKTTSAWAVGSGNGGLDTGIIANSTFYHFFQIERTDTGVVDFVFSLSATAPTLPANYTKQRRIFSWPTDGAAHWQSITQRGDKFSWNTLPALDINDNALGITPKNYTLADVPLGVVVEAILNVSALVASANAGVYIYPLTNTDQAASFSATPGVSVGTFANAVGSVQGMGVVYVFTNTLQQIRAVAQAANHTFQAAVVGWVDTRGKNN